MSSLEKKWFAALFSVFLIMLALIIFSQQYLPMIDLPQFMAQIDILHDLSQTPSIYENTYKAQWFSPYMMSAALCKILRSMMGTELAVKTVIFLCLSALPLSLVLFCLRSEKPLWWAVLGFPLAFGFNYVWGFVAMMLALPLMVVYFTYLFSDPFPSSVKSHVILALLLMGLFFTHLFAFVVALGVGVTLFFRCRLKLWLITLPWVMISGYWIFIRRQQWHMSTLQLKGEWNIQRLLDFPAELVGPAVDPFSILVGLTLVVMLCFFSTKFSWRNKHSVFLMMMVLGFLISPTEIGWFYLIHQRFGFLIVLGILFHLNNTLPQKSTPFLLCGLSFFWLSLQAVRTFEFNKEAANFNDIVAAVPVQTDLCPLIFDTTSALHVGAPYTHFPAYTVLAKKTRLAGTFAIYPNWIVQSNIALTPAQQNQQLRFLSFPEQFSWEKDGSFNTYLVRSYLDPAQKIFSDHRDELSLIKNSGPWWLYYRKKLNSLS